MSSSFQQTNFEETESFEAFHSVTEALEHIDSYNPAQNNTAVLAEAEKRLKDALADNADPRYRKAQYFQAIVSYLKGNSEEAIKRFESMSESAPKSILKDEVAYNLAAAYTEVGKWDEAIKKFNEVITSTASIEESSQDNHELGLMAHVGLAHSYAKQIEELQAQSKKLQEQEDKTAAPNIEKQIHENAHRIIKEYESARAEAKKVVDADVVKEAERVIREIYANPGFWIRPETIELLPAKPAKKRWKFSGRTREILLVAIILVLTLIAYIQFFVGWDSFRSWFAS